MTRPRGRPPTPSAMSSPSEPVDTVSISTGFWPLPSRMIDPLPKARSIWDSAASRAFVLSMDEPSTSRRADWDMGAGSLWQGERRNSTRAAARMYSFCSQGSSAFFAFPTVARAVPPLAIASPRDRLLHGLDELLQAE